jgi:hypothetical protein
VCLRKVATVICFLLILLSGCLYAQENENIEKVGSIYNNWDSARDCVVYENLAYVAAGRSGLQILDVSDFENMSVVGYWDDNPGTACGVAVSDGYAFIADGDGGLRVISVNNPENPVEVGFSETSNFANSIDISDEYVYVTDSGIWGDNGFVGQCLRVFFIGDPEQPQEIETYGTQGRPQDVAVSGEFAYVADEEHGLRVFSISNPGVVREVGSFNREGHARSVAVSGDKVLLANGRDGVRIISVTDPEHPEGVGHYNSGGFAHKVFVLGDYALISDGELHIISIDDPEHPFEVGQYDAPDYSSCTGVYGEIAFIRTYTASEDRSGRSAGFRAVSFADPESPEDLGDYVIEGGSCNITVSGDFAYIANDWGGLRIASVFDPENPVDLGYCDTAERAIDVAVSGDYAYVADVTGGMRVISVEDPEHPQEVGFFDTPGEACDVTISGNYAYLVDRGTWTGTRHENKGLHIISIADPENPQEAGYYNTHFSPGDVTVSGDYAYVTDGSLSILSVADPERPVRVGYLDEWANDVVISGDCAYITGGGLRVVSIADPVHPEVVGFYETEYTPYSIAVHDDFAFILDAAQYEMGIYTGGNLHVLSIADPENIVEVGFYDLPGWAEGVSVSDDGLIYVADWTNVGIYRFTDPAGVRGPAETSPIEFSLSPAYPNPFNSTTTITYGLPLPGNVLLQLYNPLGQRISTLLDGNRQAGVYSVNLVGKNLASGLYIVRLEGAGQVFTRKVTLLQ